MKPDRNIKQNTEGGDEKRETSLRLSTLRGIVIPVEWDAKGNVVAAAVSTYDEELYLIDGQDKGKELMRFMQQQVEVSGVVNKEESKKVIRVAEYRVKTGL